MYSLFVIAHIVCDGFVCDVVRRVLFNFANTLMRERERERERERDDVILK